ncbi:MAG: YceI family protein [Bacteroidales bacterium]
MRNLIILGSFAAMTIACTPSGGKSVEATAAAVVNSVVGTELRVDTMLSVVEWQGFKPGGSHDGIVMLKSGAIQMQDSTPVGGSFVIDMTRIINRDLTEATGKSKLEGHLASEDFFDVAKFPIAKFDITDLVAISDSLYTHQVTGNLALKDSVKQISFMAKHWIESGMQYVESEAFDIDRTQWGVTYSSKSIFAELKDKFINDEIRIKVKLQSEVK